MQRNPLYQDAHSLLLSSWLIPLHSIKTSSGCLQHYVLILPTSLVLCTQDQTYVWRWGVRSRMQNTKRSFIWLLLDQFWNSESGITEPPWAGLLSTYLILSPLTINYALASRPAFNLDPYVHSRIIYCSAKRTYENELYKTAIFIGQKESNSKFTWFSLILSRCGFKSQICHLQLCELEQITQPLWALGSSFIKCGWEVATAKKSGLGDNTTQSLSFWSAIY